MNRRNFQKQWTDYLDHPVTAADDRVLAEMLATNTELRERALRDAELHGLLMALGRIDDSDEAFVNGIVRQLMSEENDVRPVPPIEPPACAATNAELIAPSRRRDGSTPPIPPPIHPIHGGQRALPPAVAPRFDRELAPPVVAVTDPVVRASKGPLKPNTGHSVWHRHRWTAAMCAVALVWVIGSGIVLVVATNDRPIPDRTVSSRPEASPRRDTAQRPRPMLPAADVPEERDAAGMAPTAAPVETPGPNPPSSKPIDVRPPAAAPTVVDHPPTPSARAEQSPQAAVVYGRIVDDSEAAWESQVLPRLSGGPMRLRSGTARIEMTDGASLVVHGPAEFELLSPNRLSLTLGQVAATVPEAAIGFAVRTPSSQVIDLGTELVVQVDGAGATAVRVLRGEVEVAAADPGEPDRRWRLEAGQYKWISGDGGQDLDWRMHLTVDEESFRGVLNMNGRQIAFAKAEEFIPLYAKMLHELSQLRRLLLSARLRRAGEPFQAEICINGQPSMISNPVEYSRTYRRVNDQLRRLWLKALQPDAELAGPAFSGSFNINGREFRINRFDDLLKLQEEIQRWAADGFQPVPEDRDGEKGGGETPPDNPFDGGGKSID